MRKPLATLAAFGLSIAAARAQTIPGSIENSLFQVGEDDGWAELAFKITNPTVPGEVMNVDFDADAAGMTVMGVAVSLYSVIGNSRVSQVAVCGDNLALDASGRTPDLASPLSSLSNPTGNLDSIPGGFCMGAVAIDVPDVTLGTGGVHAVLSFPAGDSSTWMCVDAWDSSGFNHTGARHSFFTTDSYATPAAYSARKWNYVIRLVGAPPTPNGGVFLVNGVASSTTMGGGPVDLEFWSADGSAPTNYLLMLNAGGPLIALLPVVLQTGMTNSIPNGIQALGKVSGTMPCSAVGVTLSFGCFFSDNLDKKPNGANRIKLSNFASTTVTSDVTCNPNLCFGIRDDGAMESAIFNPRLWYGLGTASKTNDCATVHIGKASPAPPVVHNLTAVEAVTWEFCGTSPCWQAVGIYPANTLLDPTGNTPDLSSPLTSIGGSSACPHSNAGVWGFPAIVYDTPDVAANTTTDYHVTFEWANNDSCLYVGLDTNGTSDDLGNDCAPAIYGTSPVGSNSYYSLDGFATPAIDSTSGGVFPVFNLMQRIDWN